MYLICKAEINGEAKREENAEILRASSVDIRLSFKRAGLGTVNKHFVGDNLLVRGVLFTFRQSGVSNKVADREILKLATMMPVILLLLVFSNVYCS